MQDKITSCKFMFDFGKINLDLNFLFLIDDLINVSDTRLNLQ